MNVCWAEVHVFCLKIAVRAKGLNTNVNLLLIIKKKKKYGF